MIIILHVDEQPLVTDNRLVCPTPATGNYSGYAGGMTDRLYTLTFNLALTFSLSCI